MQLKNICQIGQLTIILCFIITPKLYAFGVDLCFHKPSPKQPTIQNCINIPQSCKTDRLSPKQLDICQNQALKVSAESLVGLIPIVGARNTVHSDATYLMAQLIGFTPWQAYQIMIYEEATDQGQYTPFNQQGLPILTELEINDCRKNWGPHIPHKCLLTTPLVHGIYKFNYHTGGMLLHLHARYSPDAKPLPRLNFPINYLTDDNPHEPLLKNFETWVYDKRENACSGGVTDQTLQPNTPCGPAPHILETRANISPLNNFNIVLPLPTNLGQLTIQDKGPLVFANNQSLQKYLYPHDISLAKIAIFMHTLQDRYSHHMCTDDSYFYRQPTGDYTSHYSNINCAQKNHFIWHAWEQGTIQSNSNIAPEHQTIRPALSAAYDQLITFALYKNISVNKHLNKDSILDDLVHVIEIYNAEERMSKMVQLMEKYKVLPLPGHGAMASQSIDEWLAQADANLKLK